jgi:hypothetical protein
MEIYRLANLVGVVFYETGFGENFIVGRFTLPEQLPI